MSIDLSQKIPSWNSITLLSFMLFVSVAQIGCHPLENRWRRSSAIDPAQEDDWAPPKMNTQASSYRAAKQFRSNATAQNGKNNGNGPASPATYKPPASPNEASKGDAIQVAKDTKIRHRIQDSSATAPQPGAPANTKPIASRPDATMDLVETEPKELDLGGAIAALPPNLQLVLKRQLDALEKRDLEKYALTTANPSGETVEKKVSMRLSDSEGTSEPKQSAATLASTSATVDKASQAAPVVAASALIPPPKMDSSSSAVKPQEKLASVPQAIADPSAAQPTVELASATSPTHATSKPQVTTATAISTGPGTGSEISNATFHTPAQQTASPVVEKPLHWNHDLAESISKLEKQLKERPSTDENVRISQEMTLRMLYLANRQLEEAMRPIDGLSDSERNYIRHQAQALYEASNPDAVPVPSRKWTLVMNSQRAATDQLAAVSNLEVKSLAFCTEVQNYGVITKFGNNIFKPDQDLLLYCELDNVAAEEVKDGFETQLQGSYEIIDRNGRRIADQLLPMEKEICKNHRRDYFIVYRIYTPMQIAPGNYQLRLTVEDMKAKKFGQSTLDFQIQK